MPLPLGTLLFWLLVVGGLFVLPTWLLASGIVRLRGGRVEFAPDSATARVFRGSKVFKTVDVLPPEQTVQYDEPFPFTPSDSPEDILRALSGH